MPGISGTVGGLCTLFMLVAHRQVRLEGWPASELKVGRFGRLRQSIEGYDKLMIMGTAGGTLVP